MEFKFEKLIIWQRAMEYGESINKLSHKFPKEEIYNLSFQIRRAVDSIALNTHLPDGQVSEGFIGLTNPEFKKFVGYAMRSLAEVVTCLHKAKRRENISQEEFEFHYEYAFNLMNMIVAFRKNIK